MIDHDLIVSITSRELQDYEKSLLYAPSSSGPGPHTAQYFKTAGRFPLPMAYISGANFTITIVSAR